jgi:hypothetical protein
MFRCWILALACPLMNWNSEVSDRRNKLRDRKDWEVDMSTNALHEIEPTEKRPIWMYHATIPADVGAITTVMDEAMEVGEQTECFKGKELQSLRSMKKYSPGSFLMLAVIGTLLNSFWSVSRNSGVISTIATWGVSEYLASTTLTSSFIGFLRN